MIKSRNPLFSKTINKKDNLIAGSNEEYNPTKTRRSFFRQSKNHTNLTNIIQNLQKNVKQLKNYHHQSLQKINASKLQKSSSLNEINKFRCISKNKIKNYLPSTAKRRINQNRQTIVSNKENRCINLKEDQIIESTVSKYIPENGSTMMSLLNADVDEVKKAYVQTYGKQNGNIVDLYNFFRKNTQKSTRIHCGSIQISSYANAQHSDYLKKSREYHQLPRKSNELLNVIVEDRQQKQPVIESESKTSNEPSSIYKISAQKNPTIQEIFKGGCPDLANVYEFVKKRRVSLKNYMNMNKNNKNSNFNNNEKKNSYDKAQKRSTEPQQANIEPQQFAEESAQHAKPSFAEPLFEQIWSTNKKPIYEQSQLSHKKYLPSKSSKKSQRSSIKKSKQKQINLDENIQQQQINMFNLMPQEQQPATNTNNQQEKKVEYFLQSQSANQNHQKQMGLKYEKFKMSKYYVQPLPMKKQNSLDGCSISFKSSSRIIELDFIPLDI